MELNASVEELLAVFKEMFPREHDLAVAELTIRKQYERIQDLEHQLAHDHGHPHGHSHGEDAPSTSSTERLSSVTA
ncbi:hypothetical protein [Streptomyces sp. NBC_01518]|uniref:hypothetical protein n=1 Tax=Streptomyces sp. NBC_01518 TaxID=2903891 RepID=UPI00386528B0